MNVTPTGEPCFSSSSTDGRRSPPNGCCAGTEPRRRDGAEPRWPLPGDGEAILEIGGVYVPQSATVQTGQVSAQGTLRLEAVWRAAHP